MICGIGILALINHEFVLFHTFDFANAEKAASNICLTTECVRASADILDFIDPRTDPCDDFYEFSCGTFLNDTFLTGEKVSTDVFSIVREKTHEQLASLIDEGIKPNELRTFQLAKKFYRACMNRTRIEEQGLQPMIDIIKSLGSWPCSEPLDRWDPAGTWNWMSANKAMADFGFSLSSLFSLSVDTDMKNSSARVIVASFGDANYQHPFTRSPNGIIHLFSVGRSYAGAEPSTAYWWTE